MIKNILNLGDSALYCDFGDEVNREINSSVIHYFNNIRDKNIIGITNIVPSYNKLIIIFDLAIINFEKLKEIINSLDLKTYDKNNNKLIKIPICCDDEFALDLNRLETNLKISKDQNKFINKLLENKLLAVRAAENVIRLLPPLNVKKKNIDEAVAILNKVCKTYK